MKWRKRKEKLLLKLIRKYNGGKMLEVGCGNDKMLLKITAIFGASGKGLILNSIIENAIWLAFLLLNTVPFSQQNLY